MRWYCHNLTADDAAEVKAVGHGADFPEAMAQAVGQCVWANEVMKDGRPVAAYGLGQTLEGVGIPWLLCCSGIRKVGKREGFKLAAQEVLKMRETFPALANVVHIQHSTAVRFIQALGFDLGLKLSQKPGFQWFYWEKTNV
jgi:hypothetical protein